MNQPHALYRKWCRRGAVALVASLAVAAPLRADTIISGGLPTEGKVTGYKDGQVTYDSSKGDPSAKDAIDRKTGKLSERLQLAVTAEPALTAAEKALADKNYDGAVDGYIKLLTSSTPWVKDFASDRLLALGDRVNRPDATIAAWVASVQSDPAAAEKNTPPIPPAGSTYLATVTAKVQSGVDSAKGDNARTTLLSYLLKLHQAQNNTAAIAKDVEQLKRLATAAGASGEKSSAITSLVLTEARQDLDKKNYKSALQRVELNRANFTEPSQQADALWIIATSKEGLAGETKDAAALQDLALDYMRVVANFPSSDNAGDALYRTAVILEKTGDKPAAVELYKQVQTQYAQRPVAQEAQKALQRLGVGGGQAPAASADR